MNWIWYLVFYLATLGWRMLALRALWCAPQFHGRDWFFDAHVGDAFYDGPGREELGEYRRLILMPHLLEIPLFAATFVVLRRQPMAILLAIGVAAIVVSLYQMRVAKRFARRAWDFESPATHPVTGIAALLATPAQRAQRKPAVEWTFGIAATSTLAMLAYVQAAGGSSIDRFALWAPPLTALYLALGADLVRRVVAQARITQIPAEQAEKYLAWREQVRGGWLATCDWIRGLLVLAAFLWAVIDVIPDGAIAESAPMWIATVPTIFYVATMCFHVLRGQKRIVELSRGLMGQPRVKPRPPLPLGKPLVGLVASLRKTTPGWWRHLKDPEHPEVRPHIIWLACWSPDHPKVLVRAARGYALNLANPRSYLYLAYSVGLVALALWIGMKA